TGALLAFEPQIKAFVERDARTVAAPPDAVRLSPQSLIEKVRTAKPDAKPSSLIIQNNPNAAAVVANGRAGNLYVNPYTGEVTGESSKSANAFFGFLTDAHRGLALGSENYVIGRAITGACNVAFLFLAISGLYIWFPRKLTWRHLKPIAVLKLNVTGRARDFNWHNTIGFWTSLVLIVLTLTAVVISYQWASNLVFVLTGNEIPAPQNQQRPPNAEQQQPIIPANINDLWSRAESQAGNWKSINLRFPAQQTAPIVFAIDEGKSWNVFGRSQLTLDAKTSEVVKWETYNEQNWGRKLRSWFRFTHTGETGGIIGQIIAFLACIGGAFLVYTGFSLSLRRFRAWLLRRSKARTKPQTEHV
ncbi:MAG: PepSY domain-containing protein, partial [Pyrinomonadaceae bacterium]|nr:PepSY domain-containing protein [Pyrinomonadaceae bacterium]